MNGESSNTRREGTEASSPFSSSDSHSQSPGLPHLHRHQYDDPMSAAGLRHRHGERQHRDDDGSDQRRVGPDEILVHLRMPDFDHQPNRTMEMIVPKAMSVSRLKDSMFGGIDPDIVVLKLPTNLHLSEGSIPERSSWVRETVRLVWRGRIAKDHELLGDITRNDKDNVAHIFQIAVTPDNTPFATPADPARSPHRMAQLAASAQPARSSTSAHAGRLPSPQTRNSIALHDSLHYLFFIARHHLCCLLGAAPLDWYDTFPKPVVDQCTAQDAVMSVIRGIAEPRASRDEGWEGWKGVFEGVAIGFSASRDEVEREVKGLWSSRLGRTWHEGDAGNRINVELDEITYDLTLPPLRKLSDEHLAHFAMYLRITSLIPMLIPIVELESRRPAEPSPVPTPTRTIPAAAPAAAPAQAAPPPANARLGDHQIFFDRLLRCLLRPDRLVRAVPMSVVTHMAYSAIKIAAMLWMLCRDMKWDDVRFWILAGAAGGWWIADGLTVWIRERPRPAVRPGAGPGPGGQGQPGGAAAAAAGPEARANPGQANGNGVTPRATPPTFASATSFIPLFHLSTDAAQLGHPSINSDQPTRPPARRLPPWLQTYLVLPVVLWFVSLIPEWETIRAREIRTRERTIRHIARQPNAAADVGEAENDDDNDEEARRSTYPEGLNAIAVRYWDRVISRTENIDWEEERDAQRAMGIPDEDARGGGGDEMRMNML